MARPNHPRTGPARQLRLTDRGRRVLDYERFGISLPLSYHAWGATDSPVYENGHPRAVANMMRNGGCKKRRWVDVEQEHKRAHGERIRERNLTS